MAERGRKVSGCRRWASGRGWENYVTWTYADLQNRCCLCWAAALPAPQVAAWAWSPSRDPVQRGREAESREGHRCPHALAPSNFRAMCL